MKKSYEYFSKVKILIILFFIAVFFTGIFMVNKKIVIYKVFDSVLFDKDLLVLVLNDDELKLFQKNNNLYINNEKKSFKVEKIVANVLKRRNKNYSQIFIKVNLNNLLKVNDVVNISIIDKSVRSYEMFKIIWEGEINE